MNTESTRMSNKEVDDHKYSYTRDEQAVYSMQLRKLSESFKQSWKHNFDQNADVSDFEKVKIIGTGAFGVVFLVKYLNTGRYYAMKLLEKEKVYKLKQIDHTFYEKKILSCLNFPFVVYMEFFFKDNVYLYFVLPYIHGGEMFSHLRRKGKFDELTSKFYAAQVILGLEYLHACDMVYRDLKPENILLDVNGYIKITDFGFCKILQGRTWTLCGTPEYLAPEIILCKGYGMAVDWWSTGVLLFEMSAGHPPFYASDPMKIYEKIVDGNYRVPAHFTPALKDLVNRCLQVDASNRYGNLRDGVLDLKMHKWFHGTNWNQILRRQMRAPIIPVVKTPCDTTNFDEYEEIRLKTASRCLYENEFHDF